MRTLLTSQTNLNDKLLNQFGIYFGIQPFQHYSNFILFSEPVNWNRNQIVIVYRTAIMVGCSRTFFQTNFIDKLLVPFLYLVSWSFYYYSTFVFFLSQWNSYSL